MNTYQFEQVIRKTGQMFGKIPKGTEEEYSLMLYPLECNLLRAHREHPGANGRRAREGILLALHKIQGDITGEERDTSSFENEDNIIYRDAALAAYDPRVSRRNLKLFAKAGGNKKKLDDREYLKDVFRYPSMCLVRVLESVDMWTSELGPDGYFQFLEGQIRNLKSKEMDFCASISTGR